MMLIRILPSKAWVIFPMHKAWRGGEVLYTPPNPY